MPTILTIMIKASGATSLNELDFGVVSRFFLFQVRSTEHKNIVLSNAMSHGGLSAS